MGYAIIRLSGKQYRVQEGDRIVVDRLGAKEGTTFHPDVLLFAEDGKTQFAPKNVRVTAKVVEHGLGEKVRIGKYRPKSGYRRHTGYRSKQSQVEIESIAAPGAKKAVAAEKPAAAKETAKKAPARKPAAKKPAAKKPATKAKASTPAKRKTAAKPRTTAKKEGS
jgi:large subunit ribosomal protein L21